MNEKEVMEAANSKDHHIYVDNINGTGAVVGLSGTQENPVRSLGEAKKLMREAGLKESETKIHYIDSEPTEEVALTKAQIYIIKHSLGIDRGGSRNYFCTGEGSRDFKDLEDMVKKGIMNRESDPFSDDFLYYVTEKGKEFVK